MAFTAEQQAQVDMAIAIETSRATQQAAAETVRIDSQAAADAKRARLEALRMAKELLVENRRNLPADQRQVTTADITAFADTLVAYVNA
jgi:hypothetical protein